MVTTQINTFQDIITALENNPGLREQVRALLLTQELLELPTIVAALAEAIRQNNEVVNRRLENLERDVSELKAGQARLESDVSELKDGQARQESRLDRQEGRLNRLEGRFGNFEGRDYEQRCAAQIPRMAERLLGVANPNLAFSQTGPVHPAFHQAVEQAVREGRISRDESDDIYDADVVIHGSDGRHAVVETSLRTDQDDLDKARRRADLLARATGQETIPAVATPEPTEELQERAEEAGVVMIKVGYRVRKGLE